MTSYRAVRRPIGVTLLGVLIVIQGILAVVGGIAFIILHDDNDFSGHVRADGGGNLTSRELLIYGLVVLIFGLIYLGVARGLFNGNGFARFLVGLVSVLHLIGGAYVAIRHSGTLRIDGIVALIIALIVLALLYSHRANAFFRSR